MWIFPEGGKSAGKLMKNSFLGTLLGIWACSYLYKHILIRSINIRFINHINHSHIANRGGGKNIEMQKTATI